MVQGYLEDGVTVLIANVMVHSTDSMQNNAQIQVLIHALSQKGRHFVLVVGVDTGNQDTLYVHDSGFNRTTYSLKADVVGWRIFQMYPEL